MALQWADFPSGQKGLYGTDKTFLTNGIYAEATYIEFDYDPDPACSGGVVLQTDDGLGHSVLRFVLSSAQSTVGVAQRQWLSSLPASDNYAVTLASLRDAANNTIVRLIVTSTGQLALQNGASTEIARTTAPVLTANAWNHIEVKFTRGLAAAESAEIRVNGAVKYTSSTLTFSEAGQNIAQVAIGASNQGPLDYRKDYIIWDGSGSEFNDFQGTVSVRDLNPSADVSLGGWTTSVGSTGFDLVRDTLPANTLTATGVISNDETARISGVYYKWVNTSVDAGTPLGTSTNPWLVNLGASTQAALLNLYKAIGATGVAGTDYSTALTAHTTATPLGITPTLLTVVPTDGTTTSMTFAETGANISWKSTSGFSYGPTEASFVSAADTLPAAAEMSLTDLPADTTTVRALISVVRASNSDGGDGRLQVSLSPNGTNYDAGTDRPLTTAPTFYKDISELSPATSTAWLPSEVNSLRVKFNRTV